MRPAASTTSSSARRSRFCSAPACIICRPGTGRSVRAPGWTKPGEPAGALLSRLAGIRKEEIAWHLVHDGPWFENHVATLQLDGRRAKITFEKTVLDDSGEPDLQEIFGRRLV